MFTPILCLMSLALAELPVSEAYTSARVVNDHYQDYYASDHERLSEEYDTWSETFSSARKEPSNKFQHKRPKPIVNAGGKPINPATVRESFIQTSSSLKAAEDHVSANARTLTQTYGFPSEVSQADPPAVMSLSIENAIPNAGLSTSKKNHYLNEVARNQTPHSPSNFHYAQPASGSSQNRSTYASRSSFQDSKSPTNNSPSRFQKVTESTVPVPAFISQNTLSLPQGVSSSKSFHSNPSSRTIDLQTDFISQTLEALNKKKYTETSSSARGLPQKVPSNPSNLTSGVLSLYNSASSRSSTPSNQSAKHSDQYGVPEQLNPSSQGYYNVIARAVKELRSQDPPSYDFGYQIEDEESGSDFRHADTREEDRAQEAVMLPDGNLQTVEYEADENGFKSRISVESAAGGYDDALSL